ncbi:3-oxo-tetronate kinase [Mesorhizobium sp. B2-4-6]|uniref:3-oxo-tetronate kinase n=1 Tax=Mesorhizobium sp. B2-4-6 TaxID=2589943 RepID=UPI00112780D5|nr:3-oxo-tetronate kinase [Mesorhizobium sp. B2-4-6]TPL54313.1 four-carbon acid sugar kinase family protein [Mesorhizobium sp. B2-4-6]
MAERKRPLLFGAIADDLTGGSELAAMLVARGVPTSFATSAEADIPSASLAHVIALKTRVIPAQDAVDLVLGAARRLLSAGCDQVFFKYCATFDSTPAGNIGPCAEALADLLDAKMVLFCPALCETQRTVFQGYMFGGSQILAESPKRFDPLTPMTDSNIVRVLAAQSRSRVGLVAHPVVDRGAEAIVKHCENLAGEGVRFAVTDTIYERDLASIAEAAAPMPLLTGNASVAAHLPTSWRCGGKLACPEAAALPGVEGPAMVLAGSVAPRTAEQLAHFGRHNEVVTIDLGRVMEGEDLLASALASADRAIGAGQAIAIATMAPQDEVERLQGKYGRDVVARAAEDFLTGLAQRLIFERGVRRLVIAGGETAGAIVPKLPIARFIVGPYQGLGTGRMVAEMPFPVALMLKSGKLGGLDVFSAVLDEMRRPVRIEPYLEQWPPQARTQ